MTYSPEQVDTSVKVSPQLSDVDRFAAIDQEIAGERDGRIRLILARYASAQTVTGNSAVPPKRRLSASRDVICEIMSLQAEDAFDELDGIISLEDAIAYNKELHRLYDA